MSNSLNHTIDTWITRLLIYPGDDREILLRKKIWLIIIFCFFLFSIGDGICNISTGTHNLIVVDILDFSVCLILFVVFYFRRRNIELFGFLLQIALATLPAVKTYLSGGIFHASGLEVVGLISPIYALTFPNYRRAVLIFFYYLLLIIGGTTAYEMQVSQAGFFGHLNFYLVTGRFVCTVGLIFLVALIYNLQIAKLKAQEEERLKQLNNAKSKFYTNITHEFRTPLTIILGIADNIKDKLINTFDKEVQMIKNNGNKLLILVNQLLNLSKMEAGAMSVNYMQADILPYLKYIVESFHSIAEEKNIRLHFLSAMDSVIMDYDPDIIGEITGNLLSNAVKYTYTGGNIYMQVELRTGNNGDGDSTLIITIRDTGPGIAEDKLPYIFNRFYQVDDESTRKAEGTGIGLALVKEYVTLIKGNIRVKSKTGKGTEFILLLPATNRAAPGIVDTGEGKKPYASIIERTPSSNTDEIPLTLNKSVEQPLLLIVEDNSDVIEYLISILDQDYHIIVAGNGNEGIYKAMENVPDLIICDVMMPEKDGYEVCSTLKNDFRTNHIPIVMLTAKADMDSKIAGLEYGADAYLIKPFNNKELCIRLKKLLETRQKLKDKYGEMLYAAAKEGKPKGLNENFLQKITYALEKNYQKENYGIINLCLDIGISRAQLHRKLIAITGRSTSDLIRHYRLKKAKELLMTSESNISEIAYQVGFKDPNYFTKSFTREYGLTPTNFRSDNYKVRQ
jgi:signal transduction histidine kinase/DNA-binding response OmpR family regulator